ncbi:pyridoxal-phosphate dependent enzyme [Pelagibacterium lentulum]|uniref:D-cysteine desulfhydrase n=1 Tax=Pelagibacterium lentulum TaxID=2029865 RepID=A0A916RLF1_9HYPH|nr:pyridoxal-phosphate dependent enzyme [Pelagibacterium lentulum]GGA61712.1 D-cysteine desulfhydrase [Pelagibacterium lentulum]
MEHNIRVDDFTGLQRLGLATLPTPFEHAPRLAEAVGAGTLWIKREDLSGYALGGNKLRQIDFIAADAIGSGADILISTAGSQSNFCRSLAGAAARLGIACHLHLRSKMGTQKTGNLLLDDILGARVTFTDHADPWDPRILAELDDIATQYRDQGQKPAIIQLTGSSASLGVAGWVSGARELVDDFARMGSTPTIMVAVCGSGLTLAGLVLGFKLLNCPTRMVGISAQQPAARLTQWIIKSADQCARDLGLSARVDANDFDIIDSAIDPGYGIASRESIDAVRLAGATQGLILDPIYTGKGLAGLRSALEAGHYGDHPDVVFLHSGGTPNVFTHANRFA